MSVCVCVCVFVCLFVTTASPAKTSERSEMLLMVCTRQGRRSYVLGGFQIVPWEGHFGERDCPSTEKDIVHADTCRYSDNHYSDNW